MVGDGWQINSLFRAQEGRPLTAFVSGDPSNQGLKETYANYDGTPIHYDYHYIQHGKDAYFNTDVFSAPAAGEVGNSGRNSFRQPPISQLDIGIFKNFQITERFAAKFKWEVFNVFNHGMFATSPTARVGSGSFGTFSYTPDVGLGFNPILGSGAQRNMQFGISVAF